MYCTCIFLWIVYSGGWYTVVSSPLNSYITMCFCLVCSVCLVETLFLTRIMANPLLMIPTCHFIFYWFFLIILIIFKIETLIFMLHIVLFFFSLYLGNTLCDYCMCLWVCLILTILKIKKLKYEILFFCSFFFLPQYDLYPLYIFSKIFSKKCKFVAHVIWNL